MKVIVRQKFDAAHRLMDYEGDCSRLHGHTWLAEVEIMGEADPVTGMVIDFRTVKDILKRHLPDHQYINEFVTYPHFNQRNPTAEMLALYLFARLDGEFRAHKVRLVSVTVWESENAGAKYP